MDHPRPEQLDPTLEPARPAPFAVAQETGNGQLHPRFHEGEEVRDEPDSSGLAEHRPGEGRQRPLQVRHGDALVDSQALHLMEHRGVGGVGRVLAEHAAR